MTRRRAIGGALALAVVLLALAAAFGPRWVAGQIEAEARARGIQLEAEVDARALGVQIDSLSLERSGALITCSGGRATMTPAAILARERQLHRVQFEECVVSKAAGESESEATETAPAESSRLDRAFDRLDSLMDVEHLSVERVVVEYADNELLLENVRGRLEPGSLDVRFAASHSGQARLSGDARIVANEDAVRLESDDGLLSFADADIQLEAAALVRDGSLRVYGLSLTEERARLQVTSLTVTADQGIVIEGSRLEILDPGGSNELGSPGDREGTSPLVAVLERVRPGAGEVIEDSGHDSLLRLLRGLAPGGGTSENSSDPSPSEEPDESSVTRTHRLLDQTAGVRPAFLRLRDAVEAIPVELTASDIELVGIPLCETLEIQSLRAAPGELVGQVDCDQMSFILHADSDATRLVISGGEVGRLHPALRGFVSISVEPELTDDSTVVHVEGTFDELGAQHEMIAPEPILLSGSAVLDVTISHDTQPRTVAVEAIGRLGEVPVSGTVTATLVRETWSLATEGGVSQNTPCATMWESTPEGLITHLQHANVRFSGAAAPRLRATYEVGNSDSFDMRQEGFMGDCEIESIDQPYDPRVLLDEDYVFTVVEHATVPIDVGPGAHGYQTMDELPSFIPALMHLSEEIAFFDNPGVSMMLMRRAVRMNLRENRYVYGGSTVTQQLAKNLFFDREKTLARKFEEAIVVWAMEQWVSKERILELYLNCVEFAPDVYGIAQAARHYFDKHPSALTPLEAAFLAALKPAPNLGERHRRRGHSPETGWWHERLTVLLQRLVEYGPYIDQAEVDHYSPYIVAFPTIPNFAEVEIPMMLRPKGAEEESFTEARARLTAQ